MAAVGFFRPSLYQQSRLSINSRHFDKSKQLGLVAKASSSTSFEGYGGVSSQPQPNIPLYTWPHQKRPRVCILGGGFGGLYTALRLESLEWPDDKKPQVILVDQSERFVFKPLLYELLSGGKFLCAWIFKLEIETHELLRCHYTTSYGDFLTS